MRKIHVTREFFEASGPQGHFFEKTKTPFLDKVYGSMRTKFQVCINQNPREASSRSTIFIISLYTLSKYGFFVFFFRKNDPEGR